MALDLTDLGRRDDVVLLRGGVSLIVRYAAPDDAEALQNYFRALSPRSRYNRLMGPAPELPRGCSIVSSMPARPAPIRYWRRWRGTPARS